MTPGIGPFLRSLMNTITKCPECETGTLQTVVEDYTVHAQDGNTVVVPKVSKLRCDKCGVTLLPAKSSRYISEFQAQDLEQLNKAELYEYLEASGLNQKDYAEALGLGEKTFHRWLKGTQVVSRSMGYYLRAMDHSPDVFEWVKNRSWRAPIRRTMKTKVVFAALKLRTAKTSAGVPQFSGNPAKQFVLETVHC